MSAEGVSNKVRRIAILVTSLDASAGRQLLMAMPTELARQVRRAMTQLNNIDPEEQRQILAEFRLQAIAGAAEAKELNAPAAHTANMPDDIGTRETVPPQEPVFTRAWPPSPNESGSKPTIDSVNPTLGSVSLPALGELLRGERAPVVAVVLNQLDPRPAAELLGMLPKPVQREVILNLPRLGQIDPEAMAAIHEHLASRIADYHHRQAGESQSTNRLQELFAAASPELRSDWQSTLYQAEPQLASRMGIGPAITQAQPPGPVAGKNAMAQVSGNHADHALNGQASVKPTQRPAAPGASMLDLLANNVVTTADLRVAKTLAEPKVDAGRSRDAETSGPEEADNDRARILPFPARPRVSDNERSMRFEQILDLPAETIGQILAAAETEVILYALAGASPAFMKRFMAMLDRADRRALETRLKQLRAINLKDVDAAQRRLCELAEQHAAKVAA